MGSFEQFRQYAAECVQRASGTQDPDEKNLHLNMALAWVRLAHQSQNMETLLHRAHASDAVGAGEAAVAGQSA